MESKSPSYLSHLDGLRGLSSLWVLLAHCMIWGGWRLTSIPQPKHAVDVFMILSGYLMVHQWYAKREDGGLVNAETVGRFYVRRYFRIAPLYYLVLCVTFVAGRRFLHGYDVLRSVNSLEWAYNSYYDPTGKHLGLRNLFMHVTFLFGMSPTWSFSDFLPDWSISLEMQFYAVFPLLLLAFRKLTPYAGFAIAVVMAFAWHHHGVPFPEPSFLPIKLHVFLIGMLLAEAVRVIDSFRPRAVVLVILAMGLAGATSAVVTVVAAVLFFLSFQLPTTTGAAVEGTQRALRWGLGNRVMQFLADTSYGVYLIHGLFISLVGGNLLFSNPRFRSLSSPGRVGLLALTTAAGSYLVAWALHRAVERPGIALGRVIVRSIRTRTAAALPVG